MTLHDAGDHKHLEQFVGQLGDAESSGELKHLLEAILDRLGYRHFAYHIIHSPALDQEAVRTTVGLTSYPDSWTAHYVSSGYVNYDPVIEQALQTTKPFLWRSALADKPLDLRQQRLIGDAMDFGISDGLTIPLSSRQGEHAAISLIPGRGTSCAPAGQVGMVRLVAEFFHAHALRHILQEQNSSGARRRNSILSPREKEAMDWVARGKSSWEIGQILGIAEKSVEFYVDSVKRKLQASNRTHAVVKAIMLGLIGEPTGPASTAAGRRTASAKADRMTSTSAGPDPLSPPALPVMKPAMPLALRRLGRSRPLLLPGGRL